MSLEQRNDSKAIDRGFNVEKPKEIFDGAIAKAMNNHLGMFDEMRLQNSKAKAQLEILRNQLSNAVKIATHVDNQKTAAALLAIDMDTDKLMTNIRTVYDGWLREIGSSQKTENIEALHSFGEKIEKQKEIVKRGQFDEKKKKVLLEALDHIWYDMFDKLFENASQEILKKNDII